MPGRGSVSSAPSCTAFRESGFIQVEVTGRTGDGGIDGYGVVRLAGMLSFR
jgi:hypothetical protein